MQLRPLFSSPVFLVFLPTTLSFLAWLVPINWYGRNWLWQSSDATSAGNFILLVWLVGLAVSTSSGSYLGRALAPKKQAPLRYTRQLGIWYWSTSSAAFAGVLASYLKIASSGGASFVIETLKGGRANELKVVLYTDYGVGIYSLRYLTIIAGGVALFLLFKRSGPVLLHISNLVILILSAFLASRLSFIAAGIVFLVLCARANVRINPIQIAILLGAAGVVLTLANTTRNINYYASIGLGNPIVASIAETLTYLAAPFQGALVAAEAITGDRSSENPGIDPALTTNSALLELTTSYGPLSLVIGLGTTLVLSATFILLFRSEQLSLVAGSGMIAYGLSEIWRLFLFNRGIFITVIVFSTVLPSLLAGLGKLTSRRT